MLPTPVELFASRHLALTDADRAEMLRVIGCASLDDLITRTVPGSILMSSPLALGEAVPERDVLALLASRFEGVPKRRSFIGQGYYPTVTPPVVKRNVLENPAWYTAYTPYQPEISQGRLEALLNFQTMITELTALPLANASLLDESTAVAEAITLAHRTVKKKLDTVLLDSDTHPQTVAVVRTRMEPLGLQVELAAPHMFDGDRHFAAVISYPSSGGFVHSAPDMRTYADRVHAAGSIAIAITDLMALALIEAPGTLGFDVAVGSSQRFGIPLGFGGPHAAFMACREEHARSLPGRLVGVSTDTAGRPALRLTLQTREQHIRREKATSNICTSQVLLANMAGMYGVWHGPDGVRAIATRIASLASGAADALRAGGFSVRHTSLFDTVGIDGVDADAVCAAARSAGFNIRRINDTSVSFSTDEQATEDEVSALLSALGCSAPFSPAEPAVRMASRTTDFMTQSVFHSHRSEHSMLRYLRRLADKDLALDRTMIPLGSCTMKLNSTTEMEPVTWDEFSSVHPYAPADETAGMRAVIDDLERMLVAVTGYDAVSLQPNAGSQGEFAGLLAIRGYHRSRGDLQRDVCLIPESAHGTNAASAVMAGMRVVVVGCDGNGNIDIDDLEKKASAAGETLAATMITYPSTHGVFEESITRVCEIIHSHGGQVYVDGANLNALVGLAQPGKFGADVSHLNLHKTFCIPHGGGGPGVGPVAVRAHLADFLPGDPVNPVTAVGPVSGANFGSASILGIPWVYITMMGPDGLRQATVDAILSANYVAARLRGAFPVLYAGEHGTVAHECILNVAEVVRGTGVTIDDVAKRLMDFCFHAPTMSFPVANTLMVEPTESEPLEELNRFCEAMLAIRAEIDDVRDGRITAEDSPLRHAPHTVEDTVGTWDRKYQRDTALFPLPSLRTRGYFPSVSRIDAAYGDRNLVCTCAPIEAYAESLASDTVPA